VRLIPWMVAGVQTQYVHLRRELAQAQIAFSTAEVRPWLKGGAVERLPLPRRTRGTIRSVMTLRDGLRVPADAVWSQVALPLLPHMRTRRWLRRAPVLYAIDCTPIQLFEFGKYYRGQSTDPRSPKGRLAAALLRDFFRRCRRLLPWSQWAAESMVRDYDADPAKVQVLPPGVDVERWRPESRSRDAQAPFRLLFVGGDFVRKGGPLLLDVFRRHLSERCSLDVVTTRPIETVPGVTVHIGLSADDPALLGLYQAADVVVVPTHADCFSMTAIEAMACGLPVITSAVGGIPEIVVDGKTGYLLAPGDGEALRATIERLVADASLRHSFGAAGRERALRNFNAEAQARAVIDNLLAELGGRPQQAGSGAVAPAG